MERPKNFSAILSGFIIVYIQGGIQFPPIPSPRRIDPSFALVAVAISTFTVWSALAIRFIVVAESAERRDSHGPSARAAVFTSAVGTALATRVATTRHDDPKLQILAKTQANRSPQTTPNKILLEFVATQIGEQTDNNLDFSYVPLYALRGNLPSRTRKGGSPSMTPGSPSRPVSVRHQRPPCCGHVGDLIQASIPYNHRRLRTHLLYTGCTNCEAT